MISSAVAMRCTYDQWAVTNPGVPELHVPVVVGTVPPGQWIRFYRALVLYSVPDDGYTYVWAVGAERAVIPVLKGIHVPSGIMFSDLPPTRWPPLLGAGGDVLLLPDVDGVRARDGLLASSGGWFAPPQSSVYVNFAPRGEATGIVNWSVTLFGVASDIGPWY